MFHCTILSLKSQASTPSPQQRWMTLTFRQDHKAQHVVWVSCFHSVFARSMMIPVLHECMYVLYHNAQICAAVNTLSEIIVSSYIYYECFWSFFHEKVLNDMPCLSRILYIVMHTHYNIPRKGIENWLLHRSFWIFIRNSTTIYYGPFFKSFCKTGSKYWIWFIFRPVVLLSS